MRQHVAALALVAILAGPALANVGQKEVGVVVNPREALALAEAEVAQGEYQKAIDVLEPQLYPRSLLTSEEDLIKAHYYLAISYFYLKNLKKSRAEFEAMLYVDPRTRLEAAVEDPNVYAFFETIRGENQTKLEELERLRAEEAARKNRPSKEIFVERTITNDPGWVNFMPFGAGQFRNGHRTKGTVVAVGQGVGLVVSMGIFTYQALTYGIPSRVPEKELDDVFALQVTQVAAGSLFFAFYIYSVIDGYDNMKPRIVETKSERPITSMPLVTPWVTADGGGIGLAWEL